VEQNDKPAVDWERIETDYRAGLMSLREIAAANPGPSHVAIKRRADREGWTKDLSGKIAAEAERVVTRKAVTDGRVVTDKVVVEVNASAVAEVRLAHRADINRYRNLATRLLDELEAETARPESQASDNPDERLPHKATLASRIANLRTASDTLRTLVALEREAWNIAEGSTYGEAMQPKAALRPQLTRNEWMAAHGVGTATGSAE
jgi:hypothetical protein